MSSSSLTFIGAGNIAMAIISGLVREGYDPALITAADPVKDQLARFESLGILCADDNAEAVAGADVVVLSVKPNIVPVVAQSITSLLTTPDSLVISLAAGVSSQSLSDWLGARQAIIRCMPNTPALIGQGATALFANPHVSPGQRSLAQEIMASVGIAVWVDSDALIDVATAISGSGPAYFFSLMEEMEAIGVKLGLEPALCQSLVRQTALGAAGLASRDGASPGDLRKQVTSPGGTTQAAMAKMAEMGFADAVEAGVRAAFERAVELAGQAS